MDAVYKDYISNKNKLKKKKLTLVFTDITIALE